VEITQKRYSQAKTEAATHNIVTRCEVILDILRNITKKEKENSRQNNFYHYLSLLDKCCKNYIMIFTNLTLRDEFLIKAEAIYEDQNEIIILDRIIDSLDGIPALLDNSNKIGARQSKRIISNQF
jgi:hypothetical protein